MIAASYLNKLARVPYLATGATVARRIRGHIDAFMNMAAIPSVIRSLKELPASPEPLVDFVLSNTLIKSGQVRSELLQFAHMVAKLRPRAVLEIGTWHGGTLCVISKLAAPDAVIVSVDLPGGLFGGGYDTVRRRLFRDFISGDQRLHLVQDDSHAAQTRSRVVELLSGRSLDLLFIDGDHTYAGVKADLEQYSPLVRPDGMIAFHDIVPHAWDKHCEVDRLWAEIKRDSSIELIADANQGWAGIGIL